MNTLSTISPYPPQQYVTQLSNALAVARSQTVDQKMETLRDVLETARSNNTRSIEQLQAVFEKQKTLRRAYINVMDPDGIFAQAYARAYHTALNDNRPYAAALEDVQSYVLNRRDEQIAMLNQLENPSFFQEVAQALASGYNPPAKPDGLPAGKKKVLIDELVQLNGLGTREPSIHIRMTADGHERGHWALAKALDPDGPLTSVLAGTLMSQAGSLSPEEISKDAYRYLAHFNLLAVQVAQAMKWDGEIVTAAISQSEDSRLRSGTVLHKVAFNQRQPVQGAIPPGSSVRTAFSWVSSLMNASLGPSQTTGR